MLYNTFRVFITIAAILGTLHMISVGSYVYIFFTLAIIIWAVYSFFDENDKEYLRMNGIDPDEISWFFPDYADYGAVRDSSVHNYNSSHHRTYTNSYGGSSNNDTQYSRYAPPGQYKISGYSNPEYKKLKDKCKRNFKITISKEAETDEEDG